MRCSLSAILTAALVLTATRSKAVERADSHETPIQIGAHFRSPDGRFAVQLTDEDERGQNLHITDTRTSAAYTAALSLPAFSVTWTRDCRTMVALEHLGGGSQIALLHFDGHRWKRFEVEPPQGNLGHYDVVSDDVAHTPIRVVYKMTEEKPNGTAIAFYTCAFQIDPATNAISHVRKKKIDYDTYVALHR